MSYHSSRAKAHGRARQHIICFGQLFRLFRIKSKIRSVQGKEDKNKVRITEYKESFSCHIANYFDCQFIQVLYAVFFFPFFRVRITSLTLGGHSFVQFNEFFAINGIFCIRRKLLFFFVFFCGCYCIFIVLRHILRHTQIVASTSNTFVRYEITEWHIFNSLFSFTPAGLDNNASLFAKDWQLTSSAFVESLLYYL